MAVFRGAGGSGDATGNVTITEIQNLRSEAQLAADEAELAQGYAEEWANKAEDSLVSTAAGGDGVDDYSSLHWNAKTLAIYGSTTDVQNAVAAASTSASNAATSETNAAASETAAELAETNAETAQAAAELAETNAELAETNAEAAQVAAELAEDGAVAAQVAAELAETNAETAEVAAELAETNAAASASAASTSASNAATSETNAAASASAASTSASNAATSETNAATSASNAATSETNAATSETNAAASATAAAASATEAAASAASIDLANIAITGGTIDGVTIGGTTAGAVTATTITAKSLVSIAPASGLAAIEMGGPGGAYIDLKSPFGDDYDGRIITTGTGMSLNTNSGEVTLQRQGVSKLTTSDSGVTVNGTITGSGDMDIDSGTLFVDASTNNVGIGTSSPDSLLTVKKGTEADQADQPPGTFAATVYHASNVPGANGLLVKHNWAATTSTVFEAGNDLIGTGYRSYFKVDGVGNVGIGTTSATEKLDVNGTVKATAFSGDGSGLTGVSAGATGGGGDQVFVENSQTVTTNYTIPSGKSASSTGPITINTGVTITISSGSVWVVL